MTFSASLFAALLAPCLMVRKDLTAASARSGTTRSLNLFGQFIVGCWLTLVMTAPLHCAQAKFIVLYRFKGGEDGAGPSSGLVRDKSGNLYGTTANGGVDCGQYGCGTVFKLTPDGKKTVLYAFTGGYADGCFPSAGLVRDKADNLYGTTAYGGANAAGTIFKLSPRGEQTLLYSFTSADSYPNAGVIADGDGNLYTTLQFGAHGEDGAVFKLAPDGAGTVLHDFAGGKDGASPVGLVLDSAGNLYGSTQGGGGSGCGGYGCGIVYKLAPDGAETILYSFGPGKKDGNFPAGTLTLDQKGRLYGAAGGGAHKAGIIFRLSKLHSS